MKYGSGAKAKKKMTHKDAVKARMKGMKGKKGMPGRMKQS